MLTYQVYQIILTVS